MPENNNLDFENIIPDVSGEEISPENQENSQEPEQSQENNFNNNFQPQQNQFTGGYYSPPVNHTYVTYIPYGLTPQTYEERKDIKKSARTVGLAFLASHLIILIISFALAFGVQYLSFSIPKLQNLMSEPVFLHTQQIILSMFMFTVPFIIVFKMMGYRISNLIEFKKPEKGLFLPFFLFGVGFCAFANIATNYAHAFFQSFGINYDVDFGDNPEGFFGFMLTVISTVLVPAFVEEFACRGVVLGSLRKYGDGFAILVSAILFGAMHGNFEQMPFAFLVGLVLGFVTVQSGSIWIAILIHGFNNGISVIFDYFLGNISVDIQNVIYTIFLCSTLLLSIFAFFLLKNKDKAYIFKAPDKKTESTEKQKYKWFFTGALIIIYLVICVLESLSFFIM